MTGVFSEEQRKNYENETPQLTTLTPPIKVIQGDTLASKTPTGILENPYDLNEMIGAYTDWD